MYRGRRWKTDALSAYSKEASVASKVKATARSCQAHWFACHSFGSVCQTGRGYFFTFQSLSGLKSSSSRPTGAWMRS
jgi:hypothetical protein